MQQLNDDMDELFRKAAKDYSLVLGEDDFDNVAGKLVKTPAAPLRMDDNNSKKNKLAFLFILFPLLLISGTIVLFSSNKNIRTNGNYIVGLKPAGNVPDAFNSNTNKKKISSGKMIASVSANKNSNVNFLQETKLSNRKMDIFVSTGSKLNKALYVDDFSNPMIGNRTHEEKYYVSKIGNSPFTDPPNIISQNEIVERGVTTFDRIKEDTSKLIFPIKKQELFIARDKHFYIAIVAGLQFSQIKSQGYGNPGISGGLLTGLYLNKRLAVETGFLLSEKKYFSNGSFFDMSKLQATMPVGMKLISLEGKSTVLEIPVSLKYDLLKKIKSSLFVSAGVSSFILKKETNKYLALVNNSEQNLNGNYSTNQKCFIAALNISAGYEYKPGKGESVRIEPYMQLPLKGTGVGALQVSSAGIRLGFSFPLFK